MVRALATEPDDLSRFSSGSHKVKGKIHTHCP